MKLRGQLSVSGEDLEAAVAQQLLTTDQAERVWTFLSERTSSRPRFDSVHVAYYGGALIVIAAMAWFLNIAWEQLGGIALSLIAAAYAIAFWWAGDSLWKNGLKVPGGLLFTMAVCMTPLAVLGVEYGLGWWPQGHLEPYRDYFDVDHQNRIAMEIATVVAGAVALRYRPFPFLTMPIAVAAWFMSMDVAEIVIGVNGYSWPTRRLVTVWFGLVMLLVSYLADLRNRSRENYAFWGYLSGLTTFWVGLTLMDSDSEVSRFLYFALNVALIALSVLLRQRVFIVFGTLGALGYLGHLAYRVFAGSILFPVVLTIAGVAIIYLGVLYQRNSRRIAVAVQGSLPPSIQNLIPPRARSSR
jgi:hypothetical protein